MKSKWIETLDGKFLNGDLVEYFSVLDVGEGIVERFHVIATISGTHFGVKAFRTELAPRRFIKRMTGIYDYKISEDDE
jgi:hypothetical protein